MKDDWIKYGLGMVYMQKGRYKAAEEQFRALLNADPSYGDAYTQTCLIHLNAKWIDDAKSWLEESLSHCHDKNVKFWFFSSVTLIALANKFAIHNEFALAEMLVRQAYSSDDTIKDGYANLAILKARIEGNFSKNVVDLFEKDRLLGKLSAPMKLIGSKYYIWQRRFEDAEKLVEKAYEEDSEAKEGFGRLAAGALMVGEYDRSMGYWQRDRDLKRETFRSAVRHDFMRNPEWCGGPGCLYIYRFYGDPKFSEIEPLLGCIHEEAGCQVIIEAPEEFRGLLREKYPIWIVASNYIFGESEPSRPPEHFVRLSYGSLLQKWGR